MMETRDLDRLVSQTSLNPFVKIALRRVRKAIASGDVSGFSIDKHKWSVRVVDPAGLSCTWTFSLRDKDEESA
jgi:hypothetical protein